MTPNPEVQDRLRRYLLGQLDDLTREEIETDLLAKDQVFEELLIAEDEVIDDYLSGDLSPSDRAAFQEHFLSTAERHDQLRFSRAFHKLLSRTKPVAAPQTVTPTPAPTRQTRRPSWVSWRMAVFAILLVGVALGIWRIFFHQSDVDKGLLALNAAYRQQRPLESRISQFDYAPFASTRGPGGEQLDQNELRRAELTLLDALNKHPGPSVFHALGKVYLAKRDFDTAIKNFDEAAKGDASNTQLLSDLGSAWLEKGKVDRGAPESGAALADFARSLENLNRALELNPNLLEALFNRALVHNQMGLRIQAEEDWRDYLKRDSTSPWAEEARRNLKLLEEQKNKTLRTKEDLLRDFLGAYQAHDDEKAWVIVSQSREAVSGKLILDQLLDSYLEAQANKDSAAANGKLQALLFLGSLETQRAGDQYTAGLARFLKVSSAPKQSELLAQGRSLLKSGRQFYSEAKASQAIDSFQKAKQLFAQAGDDWEKAYSEMWLGAAYLEAADTKQGIPILEQLAQVFEKRNFKWLLMRTLQSLSGAQNNIDQYSKGIDYCQRVLALADAMGDTIGIFNASSMLAEEYRHIANYERSLNYSMHGLDTMDSCELNQVQISRLFNITASAFTDSGFNSAAIDCEKEVLRRAVAIGHPQLIALAYAQLGTMYGRAKRLPQAIESTKLAYETAKSIADPNIRQITMAKSSLQMGHLYREAGDFDKAITSYDECIELYTKLNLHFDLYQAQKGKLLCYISQANDSSAKEALNTTLDLFAKYRSGITAEEEKNNYFDTEQSIYDLAIDFAYSREKDLRKAFDYLEESRSRSLLDSVTGHAQVSYKDERPSLVSNSVYEPLKLTDLQARLPDNAQVVQYAVLKDQLLIWVISNARVSTVDQKISDQDLNAKVIEYTQSIATNAKTTPDLAATGKDLFNILIKPAEQYLDRNKLLCLIPDKVLNYLPFAALVSPDSGRFLLEDYHLMFSPSSTLFVLNSETATSKEGQRVERLLSVGNPNFDHRAFPTLPDLPAAAREAGGVATYYKSPRILLTSAAKEETVKAEIGKADVIQFAVHSVIDARSPMLSKLLLANDPNDTGKRQDSDGSLEAHEIYGLKLPQTRLVVLSACETGVERYYRGEGMISMARPFMAAGVPLIVVSLWRVDSDATAQLMIGFHKHRKIENLSSSDALRQSQLEMLAGSDERFHQPYYWSSFIALGGVTRF